MVLSMGDSKATTSDDDDEDENYEEKSKENLIKILIRQRRKLNEKDEIIEDLKADLKREKKLNDMMMDQAAYIRSLRRQVDTAVKGQSTKCKDARGVPDVHDVDFSTTVPFSQPITPYQPLPTRRNSVKSDGSVQSKTPAGKMEMMMLKERTLAENMLLCMKDVPSLREFWLHA